MGEEHVVVLGQEPHRRRRLRVGQLAVRDIPQRSPCLIRPLPELRAEAVEDGGDAREPRPRRDVRRRRRAERPQVAEDEVVDGGRGGERAPEPRLGCRHRDLMRAAEEPARWHLHEGEVVPARVRERGRVVRGEALGQRGAERGKGERLRRPAAPVPTRGPDRDRRPRGPAPPRDARPAPGRRRVGTAARSRGSRPPSGDGWCRGSRRSGPPAARRATFPGRLRRTLPGATRGPDTDSSAPAPAARRAGAPPTAHRAAHARGAAVAAASSGSASVR